MSTPKPRVTVELTEKELTYLMDAIGYPNARFPHLQHVLGDAYQDMREAKREYNRKLKQARNEKRLAATTYLE